MARQIDLAVHVGRLVAEKQKHVEALGRINGVLDSISGMIGGNGHARKPGRPPASAAAAPVTALAVTPRKRRKRRHFAVSGNDLILTFVKEKKRPTTKEINNFWVSEGRSGKADNTLTILAKAGKLKRKPLGGGERGSRYTLA
jgi:hypothetical protein